MKRCVGALAVLALGGLIWVGMPARGNHPSPPMPCIGPGVVFVANGSGDSSAVSDNLGDVIRVHKLPLRICTERWSIGAGSVQDHNNVVAHTTAGNRIACQVLALRKSHPELRIYLVGHSSGTHVILKAAEALPPKSVDHIALLAPSVSAYYDLHPALRTSREGIDVYWSPQDGVLDYATDVMGTADRRPGVAAGQVGFRRPPGQIPDPSLDCLVRQYRWDPSQQYAGHCGGHFGPTHQGYLRVFVLPNMLTPPTTGMPVMMEPPAKMSGTPAKK